MKQPDKAATKDTRASLPRVPAYYAGMRSCLLCGKHRLMSQMTMKKLLGRKSWVCEPSCRQVGR